MSDSLAAKVDEFQFFLEKEWSDGFPVVTPTEERVQWMLTGTRRAPDAVIGPVPPAMGVATVRKAAIHALMAGCKPEYLPVVLGGFRLSCAKSSTWAACSAPCTAWRRS